MSGIQISVATRYLPERSKQEDKQFAFAYTITVTNQGTAPCQLLRRHWIITDGNQQVQEVRGEGVVGQTPWIAPGESFSYTSGAVLETPVGTMEGSYTFQQQDGSTFNGLIPRFSLVKPGVLH
jgi:ApaG protein